MRAAGFDQNRSEEHTSELQSRSDLVCRLLLEKKGNGINYLQSCLYNESTYNYYCPFGNTYVSSSLFFFNDTATTEIYTLSLHDALPILFGLHQRHGQHRQDRLRRHDPG